MGPKRPRLLLNPVGAVPTLFGVEHRHGETSLAQDIPCSGGGME
jgi:hypothetical protein